MVYINFPSVQKLSALPPKLGMNNGGNVLTFQSNTTTKTQNPSGVSGLPLHLVGPRDLIAYTCNSDSGKCESEKGNVRDAMDLYIDRDKVCKNELTCDKTQCTCDWQK
jgi:hypothetical protein